MNNGEKHKTSMVIHPFLPVLDENSQILILGTLPSVKSRETSFYYGHPQNRFWRVTALLYGENAPVTNDDKRDFLLRHGIALWDCIKSCEITGSSDATIKNVVPNDVNSVINSVGIKRIFANGSTAAKLYNKYIFPQTQREIIVLPSTSPANARYTLDKLSAEWEIIKNAE